MIDNRPYEKVPPFSHQLTPPPEPDISNEPEQEEEQLPEDNYDVPVQERPDAYLSLGKSPIIPTAPWLEKKRMDGAKDAFEQKWGLRLD